MRGKSIRRVNKDGDAGLHRVGAGTLAPRRTRPRTDDALSREQKDLPRSSGLPYHEVAVTYTDGLGQRSRRTVACARRSS